MGFCKCMCIFKDKSMESSLKKISLSDLTVEVLLQVLCKPELQESDLSQAMKTKIQFLQFFISTEDNDSYSRTLD